MELSSILESKAFKMMPFEEGSGSGGGPDVPQPLINIQKYQSQNAVVIELAMRLYANANFDGIGKKTPHQAAIDSIARAQEFVSVAGNMINDIIDES